MGDILIYSVHLGQWKLEGCDGLGMRLEIFIECWFGNVLERDHMEVRGN
jgi:hypothetical protein